MAASVDAADVGLAAQRPAPTVAAAHTHDAWLQRSAFDATSDTSLGQAAFDEGSGYYLEFAATAAQPDYARLFLASGGPINTAAGASTTDFSLTGSAAALPTLLNADEVTNVRMGLPPGMFTTADGRVRINNAAKLNLSSMRMGAAINGTPVDTHAGAGAVYLANLLRARGAHSLVPCIYGTLASHSCTVGLSSVRVVDKDGVEVNVEFTEDAAQQVVQEQAEAIVDDWAHKAWDVRQKIVFQPSPALTKSVAKVPVGVNDKGYDLVHNIIDQEFPFGPGTLNSLFEHAIGMELEYDDEEVQQMLAATATPGLKAAVWAQTIAAACSTAACYLVPYRADGRTVMGAAGSTFVPTESWLRQGLTNAWNSNDCDGTGLLVNAMLQSCVDATEDTLNKHPFMRAVKNAVHPYYVYGVTVVGATAAEASGGGGAHATIAGHALALMVPTLAFLKGLDRAATKDPSAHAPSATAAELRDARFRAVFDDVTMAALPEAEQAQLRSSAAYEHAARLQPYSIEGTTPASPILYIPDDSKRAHHRREAEKDKKALAQAAPNVGRSLKTLHVGGKHTDHAFYHSFCEFDVHPRHPLYRSPELRKLGAGSTQYVFAKPTSFGSISEAGASPRDLVLNNYAAVPMYTVSEQTGAVLDEAAHLARQDVIPPRAGVTVLSDQQSRDLTRSLAALEALDAKLSKEETPGHCVAYIFSYASLVNSPLSVEHFCDRVSGVAIAGLVDWRVVDGLALHPSQQGGKQAGSFVVANVVMRV